MLGECNQKYQSYDRRGFASMPKEKVREIARKGGQKSRRGKAKKVGLSGTLEVK
jgi:general stress protein YciG